MSTEPEQPRWIEYLPLAELQRAPRNPKRHDEALIARSLARFGYVEAIAMDERTGRLVAGHGRLDQLEKARASDETPPEGVVADEAGEWLVPVQRGWHSANDDEARAYVVTSNQVGPAGGWLTDVLAEELVALRDGPGLDGVGFVDDDLDALLASLQPATDAPRRGPASLGALRERFVVPPFSVLDTRQGYWQERKRAWMALGIRSELGRGEMDSKAPRANVDPDAPQGLGEKLLGQKPKRLAPGGAGTGVWLGKQGDGYEPMGEALRRQADKRSNVTGAAQLPSWADNGTEYVAPGTSIFDPVLCELVYRWFSPPTALVLDPFAGGSVRGVVAGLLGRHYTGVDLRAEQVAANQLQGAELCGDEGLAGRAAVPTWVTGDSRQLAELLPEGEQYDLVFTCPPYYDLEVYSDDPADLSQATSYAEFAAVLGVILAGAAERLAASPEQPATDRLERYELSKAEAAALKAWEAAGMNGPRPSTVNLDAATVHAPTSATKGGTMGKSTSTPRRRTASVEPQAGQQTITCKGECGKAKPVNSFPTVGGGRRGTECRSCRDERRAKGKAA